MTSVNTNASAMTALRTLQATNKALDATQNRISTGLKIGEAKDNAAYWSISTTLKSDNKSLGTVKDALGLGAATVDVAYQGLNKAKEVLDEIKAKLTSATQAGVDRKAVQADVDALQDQLKSIANSSNFSGENWLAVNTSVDALTRSVVASYSRDANNAVTIGKVDIDVSKVALFDSKPLSSVGILNSQMTLKADGVELNVGGNAATGPVPALQGLDTAVAKAGLDVGALAGAKINLGKFSAGGLLATDTLSFDLSVDGGVTKTIKVALTNVTNGTNLASEMQAAIQSASLGFGSAVATVALNAAGEIEITSATTGSSSALAISNLKTVDGNTALTGLASLATQTQFGTGGPSKIANLTYNNGLVDNDTLSFQFTYNGDLYETSTKTITAATDSADITKYKATLTALIDGAKRVSDGVVLGTGKVVVAAGTAPATDFTIRTVGVGPSQTFGIQSTKVNGAVTATATAVNGLATGAGAPSVPNVVATSGSLAFGATMTDGDTITFDMTVYSDNATATGSTAIKKSVSVKTSATQATYEANLQAAFDTAFGANVLKVTAATTNTVISTVAKGPNAGFYINNVAAKEGDGVVSSTMGLTGGAITGVGRDLAAIATKASVTSSTAFAGPVELDAGDSIKFNVKVNDTVTAVTIDKALIDSTLGISTGVITDAGDYAAVVNAALTKAGLATVDAIDDNGTLKLEAKTAGASTLKVTDAVASSGAATISVDEIDITSAAFKALTEVQKSQVLTAYITVVNEAITKLTSAAASLGSVAKRIDLQQTFVDTLMDTIDKGVGNLIDADLSEESTRLQALQTKQQLGVQALSIANSGTQNILRLFQ